jgi:predicted ATP-grasp superfamily ATP-dependent carboligase/thymidylate kinase
VISVALVGPDGCGKTTIARRLEAKLPMPAKYLYMGVSLESSHAMLPTTRLLRALRRAQGAPPDVAGPRDPRQLASTSGSRWRRAARELKSLVGLANRVAEEWYRQVLATIWRRRGYVVLFDRHFLADYHAYDVAPGTGSRPLHRRVHGWLLARAYPRPDLVVYLDAPAQVLHARKGEGTLEILELRRRDYLELHDVVDAFAVVDATRPAHEVTAQVADLIGQCVAARRVLPPNGRAEVGSAPAKILVTDAGRASALACIRSLGRAGFHVIAASSDARSPGFRSRHARERLVHPDPRRGPERFALALREAVRERGVQLVLPITDEALLPLADARKEFEGLCTLAVPEPAALEAVADKARTLEWAEKLSIPTPKTHLVHGVAEALAAADSLQAPLVLKPRRSRRLSESGIDAFEVSYARDRHELAAAMRALEGRCDVLLQEFVPGVGVGVEFLTDAGRVLAAFQHRRLRELPVHGGRSALRESVPLDPFLYAASARLLEALDWTGLAMVEWKLGERGPVMMEVNGRVWGSLPLAVASGMDFPRRLAELHLFGPPGSEVAPDTSYAAGVRVRNLELELKWIASVLSGRKRRSFLPGPRRRDVPGALASLVDPRIRSDVMSLADPAPGFAELARIARRAARRVA